MNYLDNLSLGWRTRLPSILQAEATECGLACLAMISAFHGHHVALSELRLQHSISLKGSTLIHLIQIADAIGLGSRAVKLEMDELHTLKLPCVLHWNFNHFVVLAGVDGQCLTVHDPAQGIRKLSLADASKSFTGVALEVWPGADFKPQQAKPAVSLRSLLGRVSGLFPALGQVLALALVLEVFALMSPFLLQWTIDNVLLTQDKNLLTTLLVGFGLLLVMQQSVSVARAWIMLHTSTSLGIQWRANVFSHLLALPVHYFEKRHLGDVVSRFGAIGIIQQTLTATFFSTVLDGLMTIATLCMMFVYSAQLAVIALAAMLIYATVRWLWYRPLRRASEEQIIHAARQESYFLETVRGIRTLKLFQKQYLRRSAWLALLVQQVNAGLRTQKLQLVYSQFNALIFGVESLMVIGVGASLVMDSQFSVGVLMAFMAYKSQFISRVTNLIDHVFELHMLRLQGERLADIVLHAPEEQHALPGIEKQDAQRADIALEDLRFRYSDHEPFVLDGLSLHIAHGESVVITGASGCGKSTLISLMLGVLQPTSGQIKFAGINLEHSSAGSLRSRIATVMQDDCLFAGSLADNIAFFDSDCDMDRVVECATQASIHADILLMPMGYNTLVGDMGTVLSGGQKQRVMLARALYRKPDILILDEASSHLDILCERQVNEAVRGLKVTRIIVAHRLESIASADRVIRLEGGRVVLDSPVIDVMHLLSDTGSR